MLKCSAASKSMLTPFPVNLSLWLPSMRFSSTEKSGTMARLYRSSGIWLMPFLIFSWGEASVMSSLPSLIEPPVTFLSPMIASTSSVWPFPSTPASPRISEPQTSRSTSRSAGIPLSLRHSSPETVKTGSTPHSASLVNS